MQRTRLLLAFLLWFMLLASCQEEYFPKLDHVEPVLVVDGFITDGPGPHMVRLSVAKLFQQGLVFTAVSQANVSIQSNFGVNVGLLEIHPGVYYTPEDFSAVIGHSYTLEVKTTDGNVFKSDQQTVPPPVHVDSVFAQVGQEVFYKYSSVTNRVFKTTVDGAFAYLQTSPDLEHPHKYRFESIMYVQYSVPVSETIVDFCWQKLGMNNYLRNDLGHHSDKPGAVQIMGYSPVFNNQLPYFGFTENLAYDKARVFINKIYTLNDQSHAFHKTKAAQLNNDGRFFDPIAAQLPGNMHCVNNPAIKALGLFEASSELVITYSVVRNLFENTIRVEYIHPVDQLPDNGCLRNNYPPLWVY